MYYARNENPRKSESELKNMDVFSAFNLKETSEGRDYWNHIVDNNPGSEKNTININFKS